MNILLSKFPWYFNQNFVIIVSRNSQAYKQGHIFFWSFNYHGTILHKLDNQKIAPQKNVPNRFEAFQRDLAIPWNQLPWHLSSTSCSGSHSWVCTGLPTCCTPRDQQDHVTNRITGTSGPLGPQGLCEAVAWQDKQPLSQVHVIL